jgi:uncharacterized protein YifN (PemK superfamily)
MAEQREIIEVNFQLPDGQFKPHPALIISNNQTNGYDNQYIVVMLSGVSNNDEYTFWLDSEMLTKPPKKKTQIRSHLIAAINDIDIIKPIAKMKQPYFTKALNHIIESVFIPDKH